LKPGCLLFKRWGKVRQFPQFGASLNDKLTLFLRKLYVFALRCLSELRESGL
jgi:hypothetical protein